MDPEFGNFDQLKHKARSKSVDASNFFPAEFIFCVEKFILQCTAFRLADQKTQKVRNNYRKS
jgi:hypothetical protein